jgi:hypothetical protein
MNTNSMNPLINGGTKHVMKYVIAFANDTKLLQFEKNTNLLEKQLTLEATSQFAIKSAKKIHEQKIDMFIKMVETIPSH